MSKRRTMEVAWNQAYYKQAVGLTITAIKVRWDEQDQQAYTVFVCQRKNDEGVIERFALELSEDAEGNGPGFMFGLPSVTLERHGEDGWAIRTQEGVTPL